MRVPVRSFEQLDGLAAVERAPVEHRDQHAADADARVEVLTDDLQGVVELDEPAEREVLGLHRHDHLVRGGECVDRQQAEARRRVDQDVVVVVLDGGDRLLEHPLAADHAAERELGAGQVDARDGDVALRPVLDDVLDRVAMHQHVEDRLGQRLDVDAEAHRQVRLRVQVDEQDLVAELGERRTQVHGARRLGDAALLVRQADHAAALRLLVRHEARTMRVLLLRDEGMHLCRRLVGDRRMQGCTGRCRLDRRGLLRLSMWVAECLSHVRRSWPGTPSMPLRHGESGDMRTCPIHRFPCTSGSSTDRLQGTCREISFRAAPWPPGGRLRPHRAST